MQTPGETWPEQGAHSEKTENEIKFFIEQRFKMFCSIVVPRPDFWQR